MVDDRDDDSTTADSIDDHLDLQASAVTSDYKVLGQLTSDTGVGVLGQNDAGSGTPIGVQGAVPNNPADGYGLHTPHNARIGQTAEMVAIGGSITNGAVVDSLQGAGLAVVSNSLRIKSGGITTAMLGQNGASSGDTFVWDGSQWTTGTAGGSSKWADSEPNSLLEPSGSETGIEVTDVRTDTLADNGSGAVNARSPVDLNGNVLQDGTTIIWDASNGFIPTSSLQADTVSVAGNTVSLGGSMGISHSDLSNIASGDHHTRPVAGDGLQDNTSTFDIYPTDFAGPGLGTDGSANLQVAAGGVGLTELATPFSGLGDLFGSPVETAEPIAPASTNPLLLKIFDGTYHIRAIALGAGSADIPNETRGVTAPNVVIGHPDNNTGNASPRGAAILGGGTNGGAHQVTGNYATVCGGQSNTASGYNSLVLGGAKNTAGGFGAVAVGDSAAAKSGGSFVWNDGWGYHTIPNTSDDGLSSETAVNGEPVTGSNTFSVGAISGVRFVTGSSAVTYIDGGSTGWSTSSSRTVKTNIDPVDTGEILRGVREMEVATWEYEEGDGEGTGSTQIGPMAEDFHEVVDVGDSEEHINSVDADGVAFAAIQGLADRVEKTRVEGEHRGDQLEKQAAEGAARDERIEELEAETAALRAENEQLRDRLAGLEERLATVEAGDTGSASAAD